MKQSNFKKTYFFVESVTFGERITKYVDFDILPENILKGGCELVQSYLVENYLLKAKRPCGVLYKENLFLMCK